MHQLCGKKEKEKCLQTQLKHLFLTQAKVKSMSLQMFQDIRNSELTTQFHFKVYLGAALQLLISLHDVHQQMVFDQMP